MVRLQNFTSSYLPLNTVNPHDYEPFLPIGMILSFIINNVFGQKNARLPSKKRHKYVTNGS